MTDFFRVGAAVGVAAACVLTAAAYGSDRYRVVDLETLGGSISIARSINDNGIVAGAATTTQSVKRPCQWNETGAVEAAGIPSGFMVGEAVVTGADGQLYGFVEGQFQLQLAYRRDESWTQLGVPGGFTHTSPSAVNASGAVVGRSYNLSGDFETSATMWIDDAPQLLPSPQGGRTDAMGINDHGDVVGVAEISSDPSDLRAVLWTDGSIIDLGTLPDESLSAASDINNDGIIVGSASSFLFPQLPARHIATTWTNNQIADLPGHPDFIDNEAFAINDSGLIVGTASTLASSIGAAVLWKDGQVFDLNDLIPADSGWMLEAAKDINNTGRIVGTGTAPNGESHGFLLVPVAPGDVNRDGAVDVNDLLALLAAWGACDQTCVDVDFDDSGSVDVLDLLTLLANWSGARV